MTQLAELKSLIEQDAQNTQALRDEVEKLKKAQGDVVAKSALDNLQALVDDHATKRAAKEAEFLAGIEEAKRLAIEAATKAGRRGLGGPDDVSAEDAQHKDAFLAYLRKSDDHGRQAALSEAEGKAFSGLAGSSGGYAIPKVIDDNIKSQLADRSRLFSLVRNVDASTSDYRELIAKDDLGTEWYEEGDVREETATTTFYEATPQGGTISAFPSASVEILEDSAFDLEALIVRETVKKMANQIDRTIVAGGGAAAKQAQGMLAGGVGVAVAAEADGARGDDVYQYIPTGEAGALGTTGDFLFDMIYTLNSEYRMGAVWAMNSSTTGQVRKMKDGDGRYLWTDSLAVGQPAQLAGYAVETVEQMLTVAGNSFPIAFGDFEEGYTFVTRNSLRIVRNEVRRRGFVEWDITRRIAGCRTNAHAIKFARAAVA